MSRVYSEEFKSDVLSARSEGMSFREIRKKYRISDQTVRIWLKEANKNPDRDNKKHFWQKERKGRFSDEDRRAVVKLYQAGHSIADICKSVQIGRSTLYRWISLHTEFRRYGGEVITSKEVFTLREQNRMLREENQILHRCECHPRDTLSVKMAAMTKLRDEFSIHALCRALEVKRGTFYNYLFRRKPVKIYEKNDEILRPQIRDLFEASKERFGANKIRIKLMEQGFQVSYKHISRLMKEMDLECKQRKLRCFNSTNRNYRFRRNRVMQKFDQTAPNVVWVSDVTYARVNEDFYAICVIIDLFSRKVIAHKISRENNTDLVLETFKLAYERRGKPQGLLFHSDQGTQYSAYKFRKYLRDSGVKQSFPIREPHMTMRLQNHFSV